MTLRDLTGSVAHAALVASERHAGQRRRSLDEPYWNHLDRVAKAAQAHGLSDDAVAAAYLHDVIEDTKTSYHDLAQEGFSERTLQLVGLLTKWWPDSAPAAQKAAAKPLYYANIMADPDALVLKLLDRIDNLRDMGRIVRVQPSWTGTYARKTRREFEVMAAVCPRISVVTDFWTALRDLETALLTVEEP